MKFTIVGKSTKKVSMHILRYSHLISSVSLFVLLASIQYKYLTAITMDIPKQQKSEMPTLLPHLGGYCFVDKKIQYNFSGWIVHIPHKKGQRCIFLPSDIQYARCVLLYIFTISSVEIFLLPLSLPSPLQQPCSGAGTMLAVHLPISRYLLAASASR